MTIEQKNLKHCFGTFITGVTIVTTINDKNNPIGFTANSFTSVSLTPPLLLVCIDKTSDNLNIFTKGTGFAVNILADDQQDLSHRFAAPIENRFKGLKWHKSTNNNPILKGTAAYFDCRLAQTINAGDHIIIIGQIDACNANDKPALGYYRGQYCTLNLNRDAHE